MRYLTLPEVLELHRRLLAQSGGAGGLRDLGALESAVAQPRMTFESADLYPSIPEKAAALGFSLISNHPFLDGNKRVGHAAMEAFLMLNGHEFSATVEESEQLVVGVASGSVSRSELALWVQQHIVEL